MHIYLKLSHWLGITIFSAVGGFAYAKHHSRLEDEWCEKYLLTLIPTLLKKIDKTEGDKHLAEEIEGLLAENPAPPLGKEMLFAEKYIGKKNWLVKMEPDSLGRLLLHRMLESQLISMRSDEGGTSVCLVTDTGKEFLASL